MFSRKVFSDMRRAGMGVGVSKAKLSEAMLEVLLRFPTGSTNLKETMISSSSALCFSNCPFSAPAGKFSIFPKRTVTRAKSLGSMNRSQLLKYQARSATV